MVKASCFPAASAAPAPGAGRRQPRRTALAFHDKTAEPSPRSPWVPERGRAEASKHRRERMGAEAAAGAAPGPVVNKASRRLPQPRRPTAASGPKGCLPPGRGAQACFSNTLTDLLSSGRSARNSMKAAEGREEKLLKELCGAEGGGGGGLGRAGHSQQRLLPGG